MFQNPIPLPEAASPLTVMGLMSGTSVDSVDACCARFWVETGTFQYEILGNYTQPIPENLRSELLACMADTPIVMNDLCRLNFEVGELFAKAVEGALSHLGLAAEAIDCIGSHGQTVYHIPPVTRHGVVFPGSTLQIGEPCIIAERTGIPTIADFRTRDMAAGGQGAPLVCFADALLFPPQAGARCVQNIGGVANVTVLPPGSAGASEPIFAFDTGPGNMLIDGAMERLFHLPYDEDGRVAASGRVNLDLLDYLLQHPYLSAPPPKTTGRETFGKRFLDTVMRSLHSQLQNEDVIATLTHFTAHTIVDAYEQFILIRYPVEEMIVGGGGVYNPTLMASIRKLFEERGISITLTQHDAYGISSKYKEAFAFAVLAWATAQGIPSNLPTCTGARHPVVMGKIIPGVGRPDWLTSITPNLG